MRARDVALLLLLLVLPLAVTACHRRTSRSAPTVAPRALVPVASRPAEEDNIREAVFRYRIAQSPTTPAFFLSINGKDPSDAFMQRFRGKSPLVQKLSQFGAYVAGKGSSAVGFKDHEMYFRAIQLNAGKITWEPTGRVGVESYFFVNPRAQNGVVYYLTRQSGKWAVTGNNGGWSAHGL